MKTDIDQVNKFLNKQGLSAVETKMPNKTDLLKVEVTGNICILTVQVEAFSKFHRTTRVYKRID